MTTIKILVAEDDLNIRTGLTDTLESEGYEVIAAENGQVASDYFNKEKFDLVILDIMMPEKSGYDVCREIRSKNEQIPVIMLTAKGEEIDKVVGLQLGADDYITKPFGVHELLARISAVLRRSKRSQKTEVETELDIFDFGGWVVNSKTYSISKENERFDISERELNILRLFYNHPGEVINRDTMLNKIWGIDYFGTTRTLDQHISQLRKKIEGNPAEPGVILTVHGIGYKYCRTSKKLR